MYVFANWHNGVSENCIHVQLLRKCIRPKSTVVLQLCMQEGHSRYNIHYLCWTSGQAGSQYHTMRFRRQWRHVSGYHCVRRVQLSSIALQAVEVCAQRPSMFMSILSFWKISSIVACPIKKLGSSVEVLPPSPRTLFTDEYFVPTRHCLPMNMVPFRWCMHVHLWDRWWLLLI